MTAPANGAKLTEDSWEELCETIWAAHTLNAAQMQRADRATALERLFTASTETHRLKGTRQRVSIFVFSRRRDTELTSNDDRYYFASAGVDLDLIF